ncbi:MAG: serine hydrolase [Gemmataceae bacterium]
MFRHLSVIVTLLLVTPLRAGSFEEAEADTLVRNALKAWDVPGAAVVVVSRDRVLYLKGHGVKELGKPAPVDPDTVFPLASCSKAFTSVLISQLADEGKLTWDDSVRKHLPDFHLSDPVADAGVALRDLMCHRTGVAQHDFVWYHSPFKQDEIVRRVGFLPLSKPFRTTFQYQSVMVTAAGLAAGRAANKPWEDLIRERILEPLDMPHTTCVTPVNGRAAPHRPNAAGKLEPIAWYEQNEPNPSSSIHTTARDLSHWLAFQLGDGQFLGKRLVSSEGLKETHTPQIPEKLEGLGRLLQPDTLMMSYGLGWVIHDYRGHLLWSHTGLIDGFRVQMALAPREGLGIAVLSNRFETRMNLALVNNFLDRMLDLSVRDWDGYLRQVVHEEAKAVAKERDDHDLRRDPAGKPARPLSDFAGKYENAAYGTAEVVVEGNSLVWHWNKFRVPMRFWRGLEFDLSDRDLRDQQLTFVEQDGKFTGFRLFDVEWQAKR